MDLVSVFGSVSFSSSLTVSSIMLCKHAFTYVAIVGPKDLLSFCLELVHLLLKEVGLRKGMQHSSGGAQSESVLPGEGV